MEDSTAFVVDNSKKLVPPLSWSFMQPPMYWFSLSFSSAVRDIAYYSRNSKNYRVVLLSDGNLSFVEFPAPSTWEDLEGRDFNVEISDGKTARDSFVHLQWLTDHLLMCVSAYGSSHIKCLSSGAYATGLHGSYLLEVEVVCYGDHVPDQVTFSGFMASITVPTLLASTVMVLAWNSSKRDSAFVEFEGGKVLGYASRSSNREARISDDSVGLPPTCPLLKVVQVDAGGVLKPLLYGLDDMGRLFIHRTSLCNNCRSFSFYSASANERVTHLTILTTQDFLFIVDTKDVQQREVALGNSYVISDGRRRDEDSMRYVSTWEKSAKVREVLKGNDATVILTTRRGSLECFYPRKLVLSSITNTVAQQRLKEALNLAIRKALEDHIPESMSLELGILTTLARRDPPAIEESLLRIKSVRAVELQSSSGDSRKKPCPSADEKLQHLLWLVDSEAVL